MLAWADEDVAGRLRLNVLESKNVRVLVVWEPVLKTDWSAPGSTALMRIPDPRVRQYWDKGRLLSKAMGEKEGQVKIIADAKTDKVLGAHIVAGCASELIAETVLLMEFGGSSEDLARTIHAHPTMSEAVKEAALAVDGRMLSA